MQHSCQDPSIAHHQNVLDKGGNSSQENELVIRPTTAFKHTVNRPLEQTWPQIVSKHAGNGRTTFMLVLMQAVD